jgi:small-conductance mechanosensitive channel
MVFEFLDTPIMNTEFTIWNILIISIIVGVGVIAARIARSIFSRRFAPNLSPDSAKNLSKLIYYGIIIITLAIATTSQGIDLGGLIVAGGFLGIVIGFASQSVVSNLISGIFLMIEKPVKQGERVDIQGTDIFGKLLEIGAFSSRIQLYDGTVIRVPNEKVFTSNLRTFSLSEVRRTDAFVGIAYKEDISKAIEVIREAITKNMPYALIEPKPEFLVKELGDNSVNIQVRVWHPRDNWDEISPLSLAIIKKALDEAGIEIPFPQRVIWQGSNQ